MTGGQVTVWLLGAVLAAVIRYIVMCVAWPYAACRKCAGSGKKRSPTGRAWRRCRRCKGSGERVRTGRRVWTWVVRTARHASS
jgi:hypothetical protein